jgi:ubiquinone/menaquinone biosynthesis C-methylase UbiE
LEPELSLHSTISGVRTRAKRKNRVIAQYDTYRAADSQAAGYARLDGLLAVRAKQILSILEDAPAGELLDAGCGPGTLVHSLLRSPRHNFEVIALDQSPAMVRYCVGNAPDGAEKLRAMVGDLEALPFVDAMFDVTLATGVLEYVDARTALNEMFRVTRCGGTVIVSMLNPLSPYWLVDWFLYQPALRALGAIEKTLRLPPAGRHGRARSGIHALRPGSLRSLLRRSGLTDVEVIYLGPTVLIPPFDRFPGAARWAGRATRAMIPLGLTRWLATGYLAVARRPGRAARTGQGT